MKLSIFSLKTEILLGFLRLRSKLFHSIIADEKKRSFEKVMLCLNKGNIHSFQLVLVFSNVISNLTPSKLDDFLWPITFQPVTILNI